MSFEEQIRSNDKYPCVHRPICWETLDRLSNIQASIPYGFIRLSNLFGTKPKGVNAKRKFSQNVLTNIARPENTFVELLGMRPRYLTL